MKKIKVIGLSLLLFLLCGCGKAYEGEEVTKQSVEHKFPEFEYDSSKTQWNLSDNHKIAVTETGYYFVRNASLLDEAFPYSSIDVPCKVLYYYDIDTDKANPVCSKIGCEHNDNQCDAYFNNFEGADLSGFVYYDKRLYMLSYDKKNGTNLISYNNQGMDKKEEMKLCVDPNYIPRVGQNNDFTIFEGYVYFWVVKYDNNEMLAKNCFYRKKLGSSDDAELLLSNDETKEQNSKTSNSKFGSICVVDNELFVMNWIYENESNIMKYELYKVEADKGVVLLLQNECTWSEKRSENDNQMNLSEFCVDEDNNLYYVDEYNDTKVVYMYNLKTNEKVKIYEDNGKNIFVMCDNQYVYISVVGDKEDTKLIITDHSGKIIYERKIGILEVMKKNSEGAVNAYFVGVDSRYVIVRLENRADFSFNEEYVEEKMGDISELFVKKTDTYKYALLLKSSIGTGNEEWIQMYNGMNK